MRKEEGVDTDGGRDVVEGARDTRNATSRRGVASLFPCAHRFSSLHRASAHFFPTDVLLEVINALPACYGR